MCVSVSPGVNVDFSDTVLYAAEVMMRGEIVHVLGYQNKARNRVGQVRSWSQLFRSLFAEGTGNAMILPFPAVPKTMTKANVLDTSKCREIMQDMANTFMPWRTVTTVQALDRTAAPPIQVFEAAGIYTVVLAQDPRDIPEALKQVPRSKRPILNPSLFEAYAKWYPSWTIALCCFNNERAKLADPMLWWYEPMTRERLFLPSLDCHTGEVPDLDKNVYVDHVLAVGSHMLTGGNPVRYTDNIPTDVEPYLHKQVIGSSFHQWMPNGDFVCELPEVHEGRFNPIRSRPPGS